MSKYDIILNEFNSIRKKFNTTIVVPTQQTRSEFLGVNPELNNPDLIVIDHYELLR